MIGKTLITRAIKYGFFGCISASVDVAVFSLLVKMTTIDPLYINVATYFLGTTLSFFLNSYYNFGKTDAKHYRYILFFVAAFLGFTTTSILLYLAKILSINPIVTKIASIGFVFCVQFLFNNFITFGNYEGLKCKTKP